MLCHQTQKSRDLSTVAGGVLLSSAASNGFWLGLGPWVRRKFWRCFYFAFLGPEGENNIHRIHVVYDILYTVFIHHKRKFYKSVWELYLCVYIYIYVFTYAHIFDIHQMQHWPQRQLRWMAVVNWASQLGSPKGRLLESSRERIHIPPNGTFGKSSTQVGAGWERIC